METEDINHEDRINITTFGSSTGCCLSAEPGIRLQNDSKKAIPIISNFSKTTDPFHRIPSSNSKLLSKLEAFKDNCYRTHLEIKDIN